MEGLSFFLDLMDIGSLLLEAVAWLLRKLLKWENEPTYRCAVTIHHPVSRVTREGMR